MKELLEYICEQRLDLEKYPTLETSLKERFDIKNHSGDEATQELITTVIFWEKHTEISDSLEKFLTDRFTVKKWKE